MKEVFLFVIGIALILAILAFVYSIGGIIGPLVVIIFSMFAYVLTLSGNKKK